MKDHNFQSFSLFRDLTSEIGIFGNEIPFIKKIDKIFQQHDIKFRIDRRKTIFIGNFDNPKLIIGAHYDEVGFEISEIHEDGTLSFFCVGNVPLNNLIYQKVEIINNEQEKIMGFVNDKSLFTNSERKSIKDLEIHIGASSYEEVINKYKISVGNFGSFERRFEDGGDFIITNSLDNRISQFILLNLYLNLPPTISSQIGIFFYSSEENGCYSDDYLANNFKSDFLIIVDYCPANIHPKISDRFIDNYPLIGKGPVVFYAGDNYIISREMKDILETLEVQFQRGLFFNLISPESARFVRFYPFIDLTLLVPALGYHTNNYFVLKKDIDLTMKFLDSLTRKIIL